MQTVSATSNGATTNGANDAEPATNAAAVCSMCPNPVSMMGSFTCPKCQQEHPICATCVMTGNPFVCPNCVVPEEVEPSSSAFAVERLDEPEVYT